MEDLGLDHIGIVSRSIEKGLQLWTEVFGYTQASEVVYNTRQKVRVVFLKKENSITIKLVEPSDSTSPVFKFASRGGGLHHLCFKCQSLESEIQRLNKKGLRILAGPEPGEAFENENIVFVYAGQGLNVELIDTDKKAKKITDWEDNPRMEDFK